MEIFWSSEQTFTLHKIQKLVCKLNTEIYVVGGVIRDFLSLKKSNEIDLVAVRDINKLVHEIVEALGGEPTFFENFMTAKISGLPETCGFTEIDIARARTETYSHPGALPDVKEAELKDDLGRRDFSINAMAIELSKFLEVLESGKEIEQHLIDPFSGREDLAAGLIRFLHTRSFIDDPTRIFRAVRYLVRINGQLDTITEQRLLEAVKNDFLSSVSINRIGNEIKKILMENGPIEVFKMLSTWSVLSKLNFYNFEFEEKVFRELEYGLGLYKELDADARWRLFLTVIYRYGEGNYNERFSHLGFGKKQQKKLTLLLSKKDEKFVADILFDGVK